MQRERIKSSTPFFIYTSVSSSSSSSGYLYVCPEETPKDFWNAPLHTTLIDVNALEQGIAVASPEQFIDQWFPGHVKLPCLSSVTFQNYRHWDVVKVGPPLLKIVFFCSPKKPILLYATYKLQKRVETFANKMSFLLYGSFLKVLKN